MKVRHTFLICRAAAFALLLVTAGAASITVAGGAQDAREVNTLDFARATDAARSTTLRSVVRRSEASYDAAK